MRTMLLRSTAGAVSALIACVMLASCSGTGDLCEDGSFECTCMEICYSRMESCLQSGQHDRECRLDYEACVDGC
jgi:hypothetical protein